MLSFQVKKVVPAPVSLFTVVRGKLKNNILGAQNLILEVDRLKNVSQIQMPSRSS